MPVVAVVAGMASAVGGATAFVAAGGFAAGITLGTVAAGLAVVGGVSTALGVVTGNKKLMKFGMIAGLGGAALGGLNSLMGSTAAESSAALSAGDSGLGLSAKEAGLGLQASDTGLAGIGNKAAEVGQGGVFGSKLGQSLGAVDTGVEGLAAAAEGAASVAAPAAAAATATAAPPPSALSLRTPVLPTPSPLSQLQQSGVAPSALDTMREAAVKLRLPSLSEETGSSAFGSFSQWLNKNKELAKMGTGILSGVGQGYMEQEQQKAALRAQEEQRQRINASIQGQRQAY